MSHSETNSFIRNLKDHKLTKQQLLTLRGLAIAGNLEGAKKGLVNIVNKAV